MAPPPEASQRATPQRAAVTALLEEHDQFLSAQEIHSELRERGEAIGLATVYRTLSMLSRNGAVDVVMREDGEALYRQCSPRHHHHLVCRRCGRTVEVVGPAVETWAEATAAEHGFSDLSHTFELHGLCARCRAAQGRGET
jgi:Fur family ferric uptake transcriptional regulator